MCGIAGTAAPVAIAQRDWLATGIAEMAHRGPDDSGIWWSDDGRVGLAHRRLAIVDLSPAGHQPMLDEARGLAITYNGEIYNFRELRAELEQKGYGFRSSSDTEVLLAAYDAWGTDCLARINGMFAFALHDARRGSLFLARDRAGEKPLFYHQQQGQLRFASELKALLADPSLPRSVEPVALDCYLGLGHVPGDRCILAGYCKLPPAHAMSFDLASGEARIWRYWQLPDFTGDTSAADEATLADELEALLGDAIGRQLVADVPVGILLSGGVDSSLITALAVRGNARVKTFTVSFPGHGALDEAAHARLIAEHFGTDHTELVAEPVGADLLPTLAHQFDEPLTDSSLIPTYLVSRLVRQHCTVALGGDGGDELFGGYGNYSRLLRMQARSGRVPRPLRQLVAASAERTMPVGVKGRGWLQGLDADLGSSLPLARHYFDRTTRQRLLAGQAGWQPVGEDLQQQRIPRETDIVQRATRMDFSDYLPEDILVKVDRASMLNSVEMRAPMLDHRVIEFAFGRVPSSLKATTSDKKILLKRLAQRLLPPAFDRQRKQGFSIPMGEWLQSGPFRALFHDVLLSGDGSFDRRTVQGLLGGQDRGRSNGERLFGLVMFELWRRDYGVTL
jgi:asparagine synthase (glutamine-hydrolysing)